MALTELQKDSASYNIAKAGYKTSAIDNPKFANFFWDVIQQLEKKYANSKADIGKPLDGVHPGNVGWTWGESGAATSKAA